MKASQRVQIRFTRTFPGMQNHSYKDKLEMQGLFSFGKRMLKGDLIEVRNRQKLSLPVDRSMSMGHRYKGKGKGISNTRKGSLVLLHCVF